MVDRSRKLLSAEVAAVINQVRPQFRRTLRAYRIPVPDSEDLLQDALLALVTQWDHIQDPGPWLVGVLRHLCGVYVRRRCRTQVVRLDEAELERLALTAPGSEKHHGIRLDLQRLIKRLSPLQRRLVGLSFWLGLDARELSRVLGGGQPASLRRTRGRAITRLRGLMAGKNPARKHRPRTRRA